MIYKLNICFYCTTTLNHIIKTMFQLKKLGYLLWIFTSNIHYIILIDVVLFTKIAISSKFLAIAALNLFIKNIICPAICNHYTFMYEYLLRPNSDKFGMPSGHCQVYYAFITYRLFHPQQNIHVVELMSMLWFGMVICYQRVADNKHTWGQVLFGTILGIISGYFIATS